MASKSKRARQAAAKAKTKSAWPVILWALASAFAGYFQNRSDILIFNREKTIRNQNTEIRKEIRFANKPIWYLHLEYNAFMAISLRETT